MRQIRPGLAPIARLIDIVVRRDVDDVRILRVELDNNNGIAATAARERDGEKKQKSQRVCHALNVAASIPDAQTDRPTRPQGESNTEACCRCTLRCSID